MKRKGIVILLIVVAIAGVIVGGSLVSTFHRGNINQQLASVLSSSVGKGKAIRNASLCVSKGDSSFTWCGAAGTAHQNGNVLMTEATPIYIASVTKLFTATAIMILNEQDQIRLDDPMEKYLPGELINGIQIYQGHDYSHEITIEQLLAHTSGIPDYYDGTGKDEKTLFEIYKADQQRNWSVEEEIARARDQMTPTFRPGEQAFYSDTNYQLLGKIIEWKTGKPLQDVFEQLFFHPLSLKHTRMVGPSEFMRMPIVQPADVFSKNENITQMRSSTFYWADGGIVSTPGDLIAFMKALEQARLVRADTLKKMHQWRPLSNSGMPFQYGYGTMKFAVPTFINRFARVPTVWGHSGSIGSFLYYAPELDLYMAGTIDQEKDKIGPIMLMIKAMKICERSLPH
jgi:CubicO group peptidase (beta-lactamase class C family)